MSSRKFNFLTKKHGIFTSIALVNENLRKNYEDFFEAIASRDVYKCDYLLKNIDDSYKFLNQLIFICDINCCDTCCIALNLCHFAVLNDCRDIIEELLRHGGDLNKKTVEVTISISSQVHFKEKDSVIDLIVQRFNDPDKFFKNLLDTYIEVSDTGNSNEFKFDFSILHPSTHQKRDHQNKNHHQMHVLNGIVNSFNQLYNSNTESSVLLHPLIEIYLTLKWRHYARLFYVLLVYHVLFVESLSILTILALNNHRRALDNKIPSENSFVMTLLNIQMLFMGFPLLFHAILPVYFIPGRKLIYEVEVISNLLTSFLGVFSCICGLFHQLNHWQYEINGWIILPAWINLMLIIGRFPSLGCYSLMLITVMKNFFKVTVSFIFLIIGFALAFSVLLPMSEYFNSPLKAILRTIVMMMGEFEYSENFSENTNGVTKLIFLLFVVTCGIILMNLTQAIAVNDVKILHDISQTIRLEKEIKFLYEFESFLTQGIMTSHSYLKRIIIKKDWYIERFLTISMKNRQIISSELYSKLTANYKPTKSLWKRKTQYAKFYFKCSPNRFDA